MDVTIRKGFTEKTCGACGVVFFIPDELESECFHNGKSWTCPNGHSRVYKESEAAKFKRLYEAEKTEKERVQQYRRNGIELITELEKKIERLTKKKKTGKGK
jgi:hypothetical protein